MSQTNEDVGLTRPEELPTGRVRPTSSFVWLIPSASLSTPAQIQLRLEEIERDLANLQNNVEEAGADYFRAKRDYEMDYSKKFVAVEGKNKDEREAKVVEALEGSDSYKRLKEAEGKWEGKKVVVKILESRAAVGMSLLRHQTRVSGNT